MTRYNYIHVDPYEVLYDPNHKSRKAKRANREGLEDKEETFIDWFDV